MTILAKARKALDSDKQQPDTQEAKPVPPGTELAHVGDMDNGKLLPVYQRFSVEDVEAAAIAELEMQGALVEVLKQKVLIKGSDYGPSDLRSPKDTLLKPGAEKLIRFFKTRVEFEADNEMHAQFGGPKNVACMKCRIIDNATGIVIGEGHGACRTGEQSRDENKAIKQAKKRAVVDACLYAFCMSEFFTQDMEKGAYTAAQALLDRKRELVEQAEAHRKGTTSKVTARLWIAELCKSVFQGRKSLYTIGECDEVFAQFANFDKDTGFALGGGPAPDAKPKPKPKAPPADDPPTEEEIAAKALKAAKLKLWKTIRAARKDCASSLSDGDFVKILTADVYDRTTLKTVAECEKIASIFNGYDLATGEEIPV